MARPPHKYKDKNSKGDSKMKKDTIRNIIFAFIGAFLVGLAIDLGIWTIGMIGTMFMIIAACFGFNSLE